jgi:murein DD-endopeptidase MepM/ murein hydrolase activator NlpD
VTRVRTSSTLSTLAVVAGATVALVGIAAFMMRVHRDPLWESSSRPTTAMPPAVTDRPRPREAPPATSAVPGAPPAASGETSAAPVDGRDLEAAIARLRGRGLRVPVVGVAADSLVSSFSQARGGRVHEALDIMAASGTPVVAVEDGTVAKLFTSDAGGLTIYQFDPSGTVAYYYAHLREYAPGLDEGDAIARGQVIGYVGSTGNASPDAPHLHFAVFLLGPERRWWQGTAIDPHAVFSAGPGTE